MNVAPNSRLNMLSALIAGCLAVTACGGGSDTSVDEMSEGLEGSQAAGLLAFDSTPPTVNLESQSEVDESGVVSISGRASDNVSVMSVDWSNDRGGSGSVALGSPDKFATSNRGGGGVLVSSSSGKSVAWSAEGLKLQEGDNTLTFTATDRFGNKGSASVVVSYIVFTPPGDPGRPPAPAPLPNTLRQVFVEPSYTGSSDSNPGTYAAPLRTIGQAMKTLRPGDDVIVGEGVYRESIIVPTLAATSYTTAVRAATPGKAVVKGSDEVKGWKQLSADTWYVAWSGSQPEQVFRAGSALKQIGGTVFGGYPLDPNNSLNSLHKSEGGIWLGRVDGDKNSLQADSFTYDTAEKRIYVRLSKPLANGEALEVSTRTYVMKAESAVNLVIDGMVFEHSNTSLTQRHGAVFLSGTANVVKNSTIRLMDAFCVMISGNDSKLLSSVVESCGQAGLAAYGARVVVDGNRITSNNTRLFNKNWEAGGMKFTWSPALTDAFVTNNIVAFNLADGIWFDSTPKRVTISGNTAAYNVGHGIHFEASQYGTISGNFSYGNGIRGIYLLESANTSVSGNSVFANTMEGIAIANGSRSASNPALLPYGNSLSGNSIAWNDGKRNRMQLMLPGLEFANTSNRNIMQATDVTPRYAQGWLSSTNTYKQGLPAWRTFSGQDMNSTEAMGAMPSALANALAVKRILDKSELPAFLQNPGVR